MKAAGEPVPRRPGRRAGRLLRAFFGLGLLGLLAWWVDLDSFAGTISSLDPVWGGGVLLLVLLNRALMAAKWRLLLPVVGVDTRFRQVLSIYLASHFLGQFLPATVGADAVRAVMMQRSGAPLAPVASSILVERLVGFAVLMAAALGGAILLPVASQGALSMPAAAFVLLAIGLVTVGGLGMLSFRPGFRGFVGRAVAFAGRWRPVAGLSAGLERAFDAYLAYRTARPALLRFALWTIAELGTMVLLVYAASRALALTVPLPYCLAFVPLVLFAGRIPVSLQGLGISEGAYVFFLSAIGIGGGAALALGIVVRLAGLLVVAGGALALAVGGRPRTDLGSSGVAPHEVARP